MKILEAVRGAGTFGADPFSLASERGSLARLEQAIAELTPSASNSEESDVPPA